MAVLVEHLHKKPKCHSCMLVVTKQVFILGSISLSALSAISQRIPCHPKSYPLSSILSQVGVDLVPTPLPVLCEIDLLQVR